MKIISCEQCTCFKCANKECIYYCDQHVKNCDMGIDTLCDNFIPKDDYDKK